MHSGKLNEPADPRTHSGYDLGVCAIPPYRYVWSAAELQAKTENDNLVCANVFGLCWSQRLLAMMDSARSLPY